MITPTLSIDLEATQTALQAAAQELKTHFAQEYGESYQTEDLQGALTHWLELSIEDLVEDVLFHTIEGDRVYAFNRRAFELQMQKLKSSASSSSASSSSASSSPECQAA